MRDTAAAKEELRQEFKKRRQGLAFEERRRLSQAAAGELFAAACWQRAKTIAAYVALRDEIDTAPLLAGAWETGKNLLLPVCSKKEKGVMCFAPCPDAKALRPGPFNIPEPALPDEEREWLLSMDKDRADSAEAVLKTENASLPPAPDLIVIPGLAFDRRGVRIGMGGGYYDRLLSRSRYANSLRLGLAYSFQLIDRLPGADRDVPVHAVCTEKGLLWLPDEVPFRK